MTLTDLCTELRNWFDISRHFGEFKIVNGTIDLDFLGEGQFFRIIDSVYNDGVYRYPCYELKDETFNGSIWAMAVPPAALRLLDDISDWEDRNRKVIDSPYQSESFGTSGYNYTKGGADDVVSWKTHFKDKMKWWRKI